MWLQRDFDGSWDFNETIDLNIICELKSENDENDPIWLIVRLWFQTILAVVVQVKMMKINCDELWITINQMIMVDFHLLIILEGIN